MHAAAASGAMKAMNRLLLDLGQSKFSAGVDEEIRRKDKVDTEHVRHRCRE